MTGPEPAAPSPVATYRLQLTPEFGFREALGVLAHLRRLGVSHVYASPITEAVPESPHGYDVVDHTAVRSEFGGIDALAEFLDALVEHGLALVIDHVANHASVARPDLNRPWWQMLRDGAGSPGARWFDVDRSGDDQRVVLPILAEPLETMLRDGRLAVEEQNDHRGDHDGPALLIDRALRLPLADDTAHMPLDELVDRQHYRLVHWRSPERNVRRFFTIDDLVAVRIEEPDVAEVVDGLPLRLVAHPGVGGVRIDHLDGLADPAGYLAGLRARAGDGAWILVEKILAPGETLPLHWGIAGTTGYEFARIVDHLLVDQRAAAVLRGRWAELTGDARTFAEIESEARREVLAGGLRPDLERTAAVARRALTTASADVANDVTDDVTAAVTELTVHLPRYRTYLPDDPDGRRVLTATAAAASAAAPHLGPVVERLTAVLLDSHSVDEHELRTRWQQLTGPAMAKGAEDRAFYRWLPLASLCEVGGDPGSFGVAAAELHAHNAVVQERWPTTLLAGSTHDSKRSDDVRARSAALTSVAGAWVAELDGWMERLEAVVPGVPAPSAWLALQTVATCPGLDADRLAAFLVKAEREAELRTSWTDPDEPFEASLGAIAAALAPEGQPSDLALDVAEWARRLDEPGRRISLVATALRMTSPGVPDVYQGTEVPSFRLVDPDNRIPPEWDDLAEASDRASPLDVPGALGGSAGDDRFDMAKTVVIQRCLALRRRQPDAFGPDAGYQPLHAASAPVAGYARTDGAGPAVVVIAAIQPAVVDPSAVVGPIDLPPGRWRDVLVDAPEAGDADDAVHEGSFALDLARSPVAVLERVNP